MAALDINIAMSVMEPGAVWKMEDRKWRLAQDPAQKERDLAEGKSPQRLTMEKIRWVGNRLVPGIKLTMDLPELHDNGKCPMLDLQVWVDQMEEHKRIRHSFFQKPTKSPLVFHANGAFGWKAKLTTMSEELRRRFLHMDGVHTQEERIEVVKDILVKMADSG